METEEALAPSPAPEESGSELAQHKPPPGQTALGIQLSRSAEGLQQDTLAGTLREIANQGIRNPASTIHLLIFQIQNLENRLQREEEERKRIQQKLDDSREAYHKKCLDCEVLRTELRALAKTKILQQCLLSIGALGMGLALKSIGSPVNPLAIGAAIIFALLLLVGWFCPLGHKEKEQK
jgi:hypothetical protein